MEWKIRNNRFVLFIDILGFKDLVARNDHEHVLQKLSAITETLEYLIGDTAYGALKNTFKDIDKNQTKSITFSDSVIVFSKSDTPSDAFKILCDAHALQLFSMKNSIPIKGAISYGDITVNFEKSLFFGQPIIDAYLLHEDLQMLSIVIDHLAENKISSYREILKGIYDNISKCDAKMKYGTVTHSLIRLSKANYTKGLKYLEKLYTTVSGKPRIYIDNTISFYNKIISTDISQNDK